MAVFSQLLAARWAQKLELYPLTQPELQVDLARVPDEFRALVEDQQFVCLPASLPSLPRVLSAVSFSSRSLRLLYPSGSTLTRDKTQSAMISPDQICEI